MTFRSVFGMLNLLSADNLRLFKHLHSVQIVRVDETNEKYFAKRALAEHLEKLKVVERVIVRYIRPLAARRGVLVRSRNALSISGRGFSSMISCRYWTKNLRRSSTVALPRDVPQYFFFGNLRPLISGNFVRKMRWSTKKCSSGVLRSTRLARLGVSNFNPVQYTFSFRGA